jgi:hypothetical protein
MTIVETVRGRWYPNMPPALPGETDDQYTNRLTGADRTGRVPYDHARNRQCSIGWHEECSDRDHSGRCGCPHHDEMRLAEQLVADWNERHPAGTRVTLPLAPDEPPTVTTGPAFVDRKSPWVTWPVVALEGFDHPVTLSWLEAESCA